MYKDTELTNRELTDSMLNSVIKDKKEGVAGIASCICTDFMYLVELLSSSLCKGVGFPEPQDWGNTWLFSS